MATELEAKLARRQNINEGNVEPATNNIKQSIYAEFKEFSIKQIKELKKTFEKYDVDKSKFIDLMELKLMMEKLGVPQTHVSLKAMIAAVDEDKDDQISFREFMLIFSKASAGELEDGSGLYELYKNITDIDVDAEGVKGAKSFFEAKIDALSKDKKFENEIREEQEEKKREAEEARIRREAFKAKAQQFQ